MVSRATTKEEWDQQYANGEWQFLRHDEDPRYSTVSRFIADFAKGLDVLDVGCGEGVLAEHVIAGSYRNYHGVDLSDVAINSALAQAAPSQHFFREDCRKFRPHQQYSVIVFNEVLYYWPDYLQVLLRYKAHLTGTGVLIVSMLENLKSRFMWWRVVWHFDRREASRVSDGSGKSWRIKVLRPKPRSL